MLFGGIGGLRGGNLQPLMMGIRNYLLQKENPQIDNFLENLTQQIENFPNQDSGAMKEPLMQDQPQILPFYGPADQRFMQKMYEPRNEFNQSQTQGPRAELQNLQMDLGINPSVEKGLDFLYGK
tara:strand:- start:946 stop:1317 length:372 start_codon:yes stop_codon:yes gene_type:complete